MNNLIQWPRAKYWDNAWNPIIGCKPCSPACENCYAASWAKRFGQSFEPHESKHTRPPRKGIVFCGNMTDLFGGWLGIGRSMSYFSDLFHYSKDRAKSGTPIPNGATYLFLTKRVARMVCAISNYTTIPNAYFGFTAENQDWYEIRLSEWIKPWASPLKHINGWLSCEPLLGPIDLHFFTYWNIPKWLVVGCESGPNRRPCKIEWVESIVKQCRAANVPVFVKQLDIGGKCVTDINKFPEHLRIRQVPWAKEGGVK